MAVLATRQNLRPFAVPETHPPIQYTDKVRTLTGGNVVEGEATVLSTGREELVAVQRQNLMRNPPCRVRDHQAALHGHRQSSSVLGHRRISISAERE